MCMMFADDYYRGQTFYVDDSGVVLAIEEDKSSRCIEYLDCRVSMGFKENISVWFNLDSGRLKSNSNTL